MTPARLVKVGLEAPEPRLADLRSNDKSNFLAVGQVAVPQSPTNGYGSNQVPTRCCKPCHTDSNVQTVYPQPFFEPVSAVGVVPNSAPLSMSQDPNVPDTNPSASPQLPRTNSGSPTSFYRRALPPSLISFTDTLGKEIFKEALMEGYAEGYFSLVGNFSTQSDPAFCGLSSLSMVLNSLEVDPGRRWKGPWRWYSDEMLDCCSPLDVVKAKGVTFEQFTCLARCHGLSVRPIRANNATLDEFIKDLERVSKGQGEHLVLSFSRKAMGQTGDGHYSPIGAYNPKRRLALVLDTARFKYPSYWAPVELLFEAMKPLDKETNNPRGYFLLTRSSVRNGFSAPMLRINPEISKPSLSDALKMIPQKLAEIPSSDNLVPLITASLEGFMASQLPIETIFVNEVKLPTLEDPITDVSDSSSAMSARSGDELLAAMNVHPLYSLVQSSLENGKIQLPKIYGPKDLERIAFFVAALPQDLFNLVSEPMRAEFLKLQKTEGIWARELTIASECLRDVEDASNNCCCSP